MAAASSAQAFRDELKKQNKSLGKSDALNPKTMIEMNKTSVSDGRQQEEVLGFLLL